jgi:hypothetical protein
MKRKWWRVLHWLVLLNFIIEIFYGIYMVFGVIGGGRPLFMRASDLPMDLMVKRRLYAIETWLAIVGFSIYLAITEIFPRKALSVRQQESLPDAAD